MVRRRAEILSELVVVTGLLVLPAFLRGLFIFLHPDVPIIRPEHASWHFGVATASYLLMLGLLAHIVRLNAETLETFTRRFELKDLLRGLGLMIWIGTAYYGSYRFLYSLGLQENERGFDQFRVPLSVFYVLSMLLNPFVEEVFVRAFLQTRLTQMTVHGAAIVLISTLLQTSYHIYQGLLPCLALLPGFLILAAYYQASRRLWPVIVAHLLSDILGMLILTKS